MKKLTYLNQLIILIIWVFIVGALFSIISNKPLAGVIAGVGFIFWPLLFLLQELNKEKKYFFHIIFLSIFLFFSALPIFFLRVFNWGIEFKELSLLGVSSDVLHKSSNGLYILMVFSVIVSFVKAKKA